MVTDMKDFIESLIWRILKIYLSYLLPLGLLLFYVSFILVFNYRTYISYDILLYGF